MPYIDDDTPAQQAPHDALRQDLSERHKAASERIRVLERELHAWRSVAHACMAGLEAIKGSAEVPEEGSGQEARY